MKTSVNFLMSFVLITAMSLMPQHVDARRSDKKKCCEGVIYITERDINNASKRSADGLVLDKAANYALCENVIWDVKKDYQFAITLAGKNTTLDLGEFTITQKDPHAAAGCYGVQIAGTAEYSTVQNGTFKQLSGGAVLVQSGAYSTTIDRIKADECSYAGAIRGAGSPGGGQPGSFWNAPIFANGGVPGTADATPTIIDLTIRSSEVTHTGVFGVKPISFIGSIEGNVLRLTTPPAEPINVGFDLTSTEVTIPAGTKITQKLTDLTYEISHATTGSGVMVVSDPTAIYTTGEDNNGQPGFSAGILVLSSMDVIILDNSVHDCFGQAASYGIFEGNSTNTLMKGNVVHNTTSWYLTKGLFSLGCANAVIEDNYANLVIGYVAPALYPNAFDGSFGTNGAEGIKISDTDTVLRRCTFEDLRAVTQTPHSYLNTAVVSIGIITLFNSGCLYEDVIIQGLSNDGGGDPNNLTFTTGIHAGVPLTQRNTYRHCTVRDVSTSQGDASGFADLPTLVFIPFPIAPDRDMPNAFLQTSTTDMAYINCSVENVTTTDPNGYAAAYVVNTARARIEGSSANNIGFNPVTGLPAGTGYGILLERLDGFKQDPFFMNQQNPAPPYSAVPTNATIIHNTLTNCSTAALQDNLGSDDIGIDARETNVINSNYSANNAAGYEHIAVDWIPVRTWTLGSPPLPNQFGIVDPELDNIHVTKQSVTK